MSKKIILLVSLFIVSFSGIVSAETNDSDIILIRVYSPLSKAEGGSIKIYKKDDKVETVYLQPHTENDDNNTFVTIRKTLNSYTAQGYTIVSSNESALSANVSKVVTTYVLEKK